MRARFRISYERASKKTFRKLEISFDVSGLQIVTSALDRMPAAKRKRASNYSIILGLAVTGIYTLIVKGIPAILIALGMKTGNSQLISTGLQSIQFTHTDKVIIATFLSTFALISLIFRFPEIRKTITELLRNIAPYIKN